MKMRENKRRALLMWYDSEIMSEDEGTGNEDEVSKVKVTGR